MVEGFFSEMPRQMLSGIRVGSKEDVDTIVYEVVNAKAASPENQGKRAPKPPTRKPRNQTTANA